MSFSRQNLQFINQNVFKFKRIKYSCNRIHLVFRIQAQKNELTESRNFIWFFDRTDTSSRKVLLRYSGVLDHRNDGRSLLEWRFSTAIIREWHRAGTRFSGWIVKFSNSGVIFLDMATDILIILIKSEKIQHSYVTHLYFAKIKIYWKDLDWKRISRNCRIFCDNSPI